MADITSSVKESKLDAKESLSKEDFTVMYNLFHKRLLDFFKRRVSNVETAEDLTADVFEKILKSISDFQWQGVTVSAWVFRIARNHLIDYYRRNSKRRKDTSIDEVSEIISSNVHLESEIVDDESEKELYAAIQELPDDDQYLIYYKFFEEMSNKEIADITGMSETNIGTKLHRIRQKLAKYLKYEKKYYE